MVTQSKSLDIIYLYKLLTESNSFRTDSGNIKSIARKKWACLDNNRFPVKDDKSAKAAIHLIGHAKNNNEKCKILDCILQRIKTKSIISQALTKKHELGCK